MSSTEITIDLSTIAAPSIVESSDYETILTDIIAKFKATYPAFSAIVESDPAYKIFEVYAYDKMLLLQRFNDVAEQCMLAYATGTNLDNLGALFGVTRLVLSEATDDAEAVYETDSDFRKRILLAPSAISTAGPVNAYKYWALKVDEVKDVAVSSPNPGEVLVIIMGRTGDGSVSSAVINEVRMQLNDEDVRPLTDHITVQSVTPVDFTVTATLYILSGPDSATVYENALESLNTFLSNSQKIGRDIALSGIYAALHVDGVSRVELTLPAEKVIVDEKSVAHCSAINVKNGGVGE